MNDEPVRKGVSADSDSEPDIICNISPAACEENTDACCETACGCKTTARSDDERRRLKNRLSRIEGQIRGIIGMIERDAYCNDILIQSAAVSAAVDAFNRELVAAHIRNCVARDIRAGDDSVIDELINTLGKLIK